MIVGREIAKTNFTTFFSAHAPLFRPSRVSATVGSMDGAIHVDSDRSLRRTGPIELRDSGPTGRKLGTPDDCYEDSPWELHRGELVERLMAHDTHSIAMGILTALFRNHLRDGYTVMDDIDCVLDDAYSESRRAPDVVIVHQLRNTKNEAYSGIPVLAVEVRATQSKRHLDEKVTLYLEHDWPEVWLVHTERQEVEVVRSGVASVVYRKGTRVPLLPELDKYGLSSMPVTAFFDDVEASKYIDQWVRQSGYADGRTQERARAVLDVLAARGLAVPSSARDRIMSCTNLETLQRWFTLALSARTVDEFVQGMS